MNPLQLGYTVHVLIRCEMTNAYRSYSVLCFGCLMMGCRDTLQGTWTGEFECQDRTYDVTAQFVEEDRFEFDGEMIFSYDEQTTFPVAIPWFFSCRLKI